MDSPKRLMGRRRVERNALFLSMHPLCVECKRCGRARIAAEVDHKIPLYLGGIESEENLQGLCADCHRTKTARDFGRKIRGCDERGTPTDLSHPWGAA